MQFKVFRYIFVSLFAFIIVLNFPIVTTAANTEAYDKAYQDNKGDVIIPQGTPVDDYSSFDIIYLETDDNGVDAVTAIMLLAAPVDNSALYTIRVGDLENESNIIVGVYDSNLAIITYPDNSTSQEVEAKDNKIIWVFDRVKMTKFNKYDIDGVTHQYVEDPITDTKVILKDQAGTEAGSTEVEVETGAAENCDVDGDKKDKDDGKSILGIDSTLLIGVIAFIALVIILVILYSKVYRKKSK